jgi:predicted transcriptional regulator
MPRSCSRALALQVWRVERLAACDEAGLSKSGQGRHARHEEGEKRWKERER